MKKTEEIFSTLGLSKDNGLYLTNEDRWKTETSFPNRVKRLIERKIEPTAFFCFDNKPMILFFDNPANKADLHEAIWNFNECPIAIIIENDMVEIFNGFNYLKDKRSLEKLGENDNLNDFSYFELVTGRTWEQYKEHLDYKNRVDYHLLQNIKAARQLLVGDNEKRAKLVNALLGKVIFVRYLIDRKVKMKFNGKLRTWTNAEFCALLDNPQQIQQFFEYLEDKEKGFNGDLFPLSASEYKQVRKGDYQVLKRLLLGEDIAKNQPSLFELYDFSIIPIEFISNVYELFIGQDNQKKEGAYYTPLFLVDYILKETVEKKLSNPDSGYSCKVLDPACGSGIFLVETLRKIIEKYVADTGIEPKEEKNKFIKAIKNLVKENIYGIDKDESAVQVAIFSIYLTLLDYLEPAAIEDAFKFPLLLNTNFFHADFFDEGKDFNKILGKIEFDYILGNPPWMRGKGEKTKPLYVEYIEKRRKEEQRTDNPQIEIGNKEIAQAFLIRSRDFSKPVTKCALIVTSKVLYNLQSKSFRKYFLHNFFIQRVFELAPVRREVFDKSNDKAIAPACVLFFNYSNGTSTDLNIIEHIALKPSRFFSLFKIFTINRTDFKEVQQSKLKEYDWLWKVLVYGSYLDFNFLLRLRNEYDSINDFLLKSKALVKQGIKRKDGDKKINVTELVGWDFLDLNKKEIEQFFITPKHHKWKLKEVGYIFREDNQVCKDVFTPPVLLIKETVNTKLESISAISTKKILFTDKVTSVKYRESNDTNSYHLLSGLINSTLFAYYVLNVSSTAGIMIEQQINDEEKFGFPFKFSDNVIDTAKEIERLKKGIFSQTLVDNGKKQELREKEFLINKHIIKTFELSHQEKALVDYAQNTMIPMAMKHKNFSAIFHSLDYQDSILNEYAQLFLNRFQSNLSNKDRKFIVEVWHTNQIVGMFFKVIPAKEYNGDIIWKSKQDSDLEILSLLTKISSEKVTDKLFVQKDIRGFEEDYFYIFKPNERRLWHKAIGYLDVNEFADAILKAGKKGW
ncbi:MAG TPA: N-6 DNA methylase [Edaphocola sp.]|nr:N-6 DNA methylase [Edaphocola sp.]